MRKNDKYFIAGALVLGAAVSIMVYAGKKFTSFKRVVANYIQEEEITALELTRLSSEPGEKREIVITDRDTIHEIMKGFNEVQLIKSAKNMKSDHKFSYYITIIQKDLRHRFDIILKSREHLIIYDNNASKPRLNAYKLKSPFNSQVLERQFE
ncbi:hypothetical protein D3C74_75320 [compost metagenome]